MGHSQRRTGPRGTRWIALYRDARGRQLSAGSYATKRDADAAWQQADLLRRSGRAGDSDSRRIVFANYVELRWLPNHVLEPSTRESYVYNLNRHILPWFGAMKMRDILPVHVREWVTHLVAHEVSPAQIRHLKIILSAVFTTALNDLVVLLHPCRGVKTPTVPVKEYRILAPGEYDALQASLPSQTARLLVETAMGSGLRWGELSELRPMDLQPATGILLVSRAVAEVNPKYHPDGGRFVVKPYPKSRRSRRLKLDPDLVAAIGDYVRTRGLRSDDLLFSYSLLVSDGPTQARFLVDADQLGVTEPNAAGRTYRHGTLSAYTAGRCRCDHCRAGFAAYRARRRADGHDEPRGARARDTDGHVPRDWFRTNVWLPACAEAGLDPRPRLHDLRHSHASWLLAGGADLQVVKQRLGHKSIATTGRYLHTLPTADESALAALRRVRRR